jgi:hypothetical protein
MHSYVLQDWITIRGQSLNQVVTQGESGWLDLAPYQDLSLWLDVREFSPATPPIMRFQTAPFKEEGLFVPMYADITIALTASLTNPYRVPVTAGGTLCPVARYVRWQVQGPASGTMPWDVTFRILCAADALGL